MYAKVYISIAQLKDLNSALFVSLKNAIHKS